MSRRASNYYTDAIITLNPKSKNPKELLKIFKSQIEDVVIGSNEELPDKEALQVGFDGGGFGVK